MTGTRTQVVALLLFAAAAWVLYYQVLAYRIVLQYQTPASFFLFTRDFLFQWLDHPGGLLLYAGRFLRQFFHYVWAGALVVALISTLTAGGLVLLVRRSGGSSLILPLLPCVYLLIRHAASTTALGVLVVVVALVACSAPLRGHRGNGSGVWFGSSWWNALRRARGRQAPGLPGSSWSNAPSRMPPWDVGALLLLPVLYWAVGAFAWLFVGYLVLSALLLAPTPWRRRLRLPLLLLSEALLLPPIAYRWLFPVSWHTAWLAPLGWPLPLLDWLLFAFLIALPLAASASRWTPMLSAWHKGLVKSWNRALQTAILVLVATLLLAQADAPKLRLLARYDQLYRARRWNDILALADRQAPLRGTADVEDALIQFFVDHALCRTGRLLDRMFHYPQPWGTRGLVLNLPDYADNVRLAGYTSDLFYVLGHVNAAYRSAYDQRVVSGRTYANTQRLAECALVNGSGALAGKYVTLLEHTLFHRTTAQRLRRLVADPRLAAHALAAQRQRLPVLELDVGLGDVGALLALARGPQPNRMAMEYLIAWCLLDKRALPLAVDELLALRRVGYARLPIHCQEALLLWCSVQGMSLEKARQLCTPTVQRRFDQFRSGRLRTGTALAAGRHSRDQGAGTYMGYYASAIPPASYVPLHSFQRLAAEFLARGDTVAFQALRAQDWLHSGEYAAQSGLRRSAPTTRSHQ